MLSIMVKVVAENRKARHDYFIDETFEAGLVLMGTEIKSIRQGKVQLKDAFVTFIGNEAFIKGMHIAQYKEGNIFNHEETRERKLLLHRKEISDLSRAVQVKGQTIVPLRMILRDGRAKLEIALATGKHLYDKRQTEKDRDAKREIEKSMKYRG